MDTLIPLSLYFPHSFLLKLSEFLISPAFGSSSNHPIKSPVQFPKTFHLPPLMRPRLPASNLHSPKGNLDSCSPWLMNSGAEALLGQPWEETRQGLLSSKCLIWVPAGHCAPCAPLCLRRWAFHGPSLVGVGVTQQSLNSLTICTYLNLSYLNQTKQVSNKSGQKNSINKVQEQQNRMPMSNVLILLLIII